MIILRFYLIIILTFIIGCKQEDDTGPDVETSIENEPRWKELSSFPNGGRILSTAFVIGDKAYVTTGASAYNGSYYKDLWEYNPKTDQWSRKADFPGAARYMTKSFVIGNMAYVGGGMISGSSGAKDLYQYNPSTNSWKKMADAPEDIYWGTVTAHQEKAYFFSEATYKNLLVYDSGLNTWTTIGSIPTYSFFEGSSSFAINDKLYYGFGIHQYPWSDGKKHINSTLMSYDGKYWATEDQRPPSDLQSSLRNPFVYNNEVYMSFGDIGTLYAYNPLTKKWRLFVKQVLDVSSNASGFMIGSKCYVVFGHNSFYEDGNNRMWVIDLNQK